MNYWSNAVNLVGGENKIYAEILFDRDCLEGCLTYYTEYNATGTQFAIHNRLFF